MTAIPPDPLRNMNISASKVHLAMICATSAVLPKGEMRSASRGKASDAGGYRHAFLAAIPKYGREAALAAAPEAFRGEFGAINTDALPIKQGALLSTEIGFAYNVLEGTGRELTARGDQGYEGVRFGEIPGTADVFGIAADGQSVIIIDWKTPWAEVPPARSNWQLMTLALASTKAFGINEATVAICRIRDDGEPYFDVATLDAFDLDSAADDLKKLWPRMVTAAREYDAGREPPVSMGEHCGWCPGVAHCRAQKGLVRAVAGLPERVGEWALPLNDEVAVASWEKIALLEDLLDMAKKGIKSYSKSHPLTLPNGDVLGLIEASSEKIDGTKAYVVLVQEFGHDLADAMVKLSVTKAAIKKIICDRVLPERRKGGKVTMKSVEEDIHERLRETGAMTKRTYSTVKVHKAGQAQIEDSDG